MIKKCLVCGKEFKCSPSAKIVTCSKECSRKRRSGLLKGKERSKAVRSKISKSAKGRDMSELQIKGTAAAMQSPKAGRFETNSSAKKWVLLSPDKQIYERMNLREWLRNNAQELFGVEPTDENIGRIGHGFSTIKRNLKARKSTITYKDWTLLNWSDEKQCEMNKEKNGKE